MTTYRDPTWGFPTKAAFAAIAAATLWFSVPSSIFIRPVNVAVVKDPSDRWVMISERETPYGAVSIHFQALVQVLGREDGQDCQFSSDALVVPKENNITRVDITDWAAPCLDAGPPISVKLTRTVHLFNVIPLRPVHYSFTINPESAPVLSADGEAQ